ncbi:hypothetical protein [Haloarchaeobius sp. HRN-SO-5]|uniref:hypothetical protein n=1 Tax=Haloarchaeobius sp. HRN-SO-5 TaxID=3446118 RepID=UPI003EC0B154
MKLTETDLVIPGRRRDVRNIAANVALENDRDRNEVHVVCAAGEPADVDDPASSIADVESGGIAAAPDASDFDFATAVHLDCRVDVAVPRRRPLYKKNGAILPGPSTFGRWELSRSNTAVTDRHRPYLISLMSD